MGTILEKLRRLHIRWVHDRDYGCRHALGRDKKYLADGTTKEYGSLSTLTNITATSTNFVFGTPGPAVGYRIDKPSGGQDVFGWVYSYQDLAEEWVYRAMLTESTDAI